jgi:hypothetical protein
MDVDTICTELLTALTEAQYHEHTIFTVKP